MNHVYEHEYAILVPLTVPATAQPGAKLPVALLLPLAVNLICTCMVGFLQ